MYGATRLAGKFSKMLPKDDVSTMILGGVGASALGAGGSLAGNLADDQIGEGPLRLGMEASNAAAAASIPGMIGGYGLGVANRSKARAISALRNRSLNAPELKEVARRTGKAAKNTAAVSSALIPVTAGIGGLMGGGSANLYEAMKIPGFSSGIDPEQYGPSNTQNSLYQMQGDLSRMM